MTKFFKIEFICNYFKKTLTKMAESKNKSYIFSFMPRTDEVEEYHRALQKWNNIPESDLQVKCRSSYVKNKDDERVLKLSYFFKDKDGESCVSNIFHYQTKEEIESMLTDCGMKDFSWINPLSDEEITGECNSLEQYLVCHS